MKGATSLKHTIRTLILFTIVLTFPPSPSATAQTCGTVFPDSYLSRELDRARTGYYSSQEIAVGTPYQIPVAVHIIRRSDGSGPDGPCPGAPLDTLPHPGVFRTGQVDTALADLNAMFAPLGWTFYQYGPIRYIDNDDFYCLTLSGEGVYEIAVAHSIPEAINVFFAPNTGLSGVEIYVPNAKGILIDASAAGVESNPSTLAHEVGHYFGLLHTHHLWWDGSSFIFECPNGSNCVTAGDLICDTPADPNLVNYSDTFCTFLPIAPLPAGCGSTPYNPDVHNLMSYAWATCRYEFTDGQIARMTYTLENERPELLVTTDIPDRPEGELPGSFTVRQNYPNPFNPSTVIEFSLSAAADVEVTVYNTLGQSVRTLIKQVLGAGDYQVSWDGTTDSGEPAASGVYLYRVAAGEQSLSKKMLLLR
ncbi:T9SS type A sorting domain-containing protein [bacterium]|nr:T9SS type A sorting domain-containing protein [bacterium]